MSAPKGVLLACLLGSAFLGAVVARPDWLRAVGVEVATPRPVATIFLEQSRECWVGDRRFAAKGRVTARLAAGEMDLYAAAAWFRDLNHEPTDCPDLGYLRLPGVTREEKLCREVIQWAGAFGRDLEQASAATLPADLEAALASRLCMGGQIELPRRG
jgi:hypothetical protein